MRKATIEHVDNQLLLEAFLEFDSFALCLHLYCVLSYNVIYVSFIVELISFGRFMQMSQT